MKRVVTASLMKALDGNTIERHRVPSMVLMERAALAVVDALSGWNLEKVLVVCGNGNNGGDGIAAARILKGKGYSVHICQPGADRRKSADCVRQEEIARSYDVTWVNNPNWSEYTTIVDAIFGVGLSRNIEGIFAETIQKINESGVPVMAVDVPSGIDSDTGQILGCAVRARETVTFAFAKAGQLLEPGYGYCGRLKICDIGIYDSEHLEKEDTFFIEEKDMEQIPLRREDGNKGSFGKILLAAGSTGMAGAAYLCGLAAMRTGCGMVKIVTPAENRDILQKRIPEAMLSVYETEQEAEQCILEGLKWADTAGIGPGLGQDKRAETMIRTILKNCDHPLVVDADALNLISAHKEWVDDLKCPAVITPHLGEMARLMNCKVSHIKSSVLATARAFAADHKLQCVLKDSRTCVALPDGTAYINRTGNSGMATAGSGDVLCGIILGLLAQKTPYAYAGAIGVWLHGKLGDRCSSRTGPGFVMAGDLVDELKYFRIGDTKGERNEKV